MGIFSLQEWKSLWKMHKPSTPKSRRYVHPQRPRFEEYSSEYPSEGEFSSQTSFSQDGSSPRRGRSGDGRGRAAPSLPIGYYRCRPSPTEAAVQPSPSKRLPDQPPSGRWSPVAKTTTTDSSDSIESAGPGKCSVQQRISIFDRPRNSATKHHDNNRPKTDHKSLPGPGKPVTSLPTKQPSSSTLPSSEAKSKIDSKSSGERLHRAGADRRATDGPAPRTAAQPEKFGEVLSKFQRLELRSRLRQFAASRDGTRSRPASTYAPQLSSDEVDATQQDDLQLNTSLKSKFKSEVDVADRAQLRETYRSAVALFSSADTQ